MKKLLSFLPILLLVTGQFSVAQVGTVKQNNEILSYTFIQHLSDPGNTGMPNFSLLKLKTKSIGRTKHHNSLSAANTDALNFGLLKSKNSKLKGNSEPFIAKFARNDIKNKPYKTREISNLNFGTFKETQDGGGIDIKIAGRTSLNLDPIGCYEGSDPGAASDSCGQSPDLDMSISFVFDLK